MPLHPVLSSDRAAGVAAVLGTIATGLIGGLIAAQLGAPLPMLLGSLVAVGAVSIAGVKIAGRAPGMAQEVRLFFIPVVGVAIGAAFTPDLLAEAVDWWPTLLALLLYLPLAHGAGALIYSRARGMDRITAYYAAIPGGLIDAIQMGEEAGAQMRPLITLQFLRLILCIMFIPLAFMAVTGHAVGSAAGVSLSTGTAPLTGGEVAILVAAGALGGYGGRRLGLPAGIITGPIILSGLAHLTGLAGSAPPDWMIAGCQLVIGSSLGSRFVGLTAAEFARSAALAFANMLATLGFALLAALTLADLANEPPEAVILAYAPGGLAEMSLIAVSMQISVVYVTAHHVTRLLLAVAMARALRSRFAQPPAEDPAQAKHDDPS